MEILLVEDEAPIRELVGLYLAKEGFRVTTAENGGRALAELEERDFSLVVLDLMLPDIDGFAVCRKLRERSDVPVIMLTARADDVDKVLGLELGADDYLTKPFNPRELVARVRAVLRRSELRAASTAVLRIGDLQLDRASREVQVNGNGIVLRAREFEVLATLMEHAGQALTREQLLSLVWGYDFFGETRTVDVHIQQVRRKIEPSAVRIETLRGVGYKLVAPQAAAPHSRSGHNGAAHGRAGRNGAPYGGTSYSGSLHSGSP